MNLPQNVSELMQSLPRYPEDLLLIKLKEGNSVKNLSVGRQVVSDALAY